MEEKNKLAIKAAKKDVDVVVAKDEDKDEEDSTILRIKKEVKMIDQQEDVEEEVTPVWDLY